MAKFILKTIITTGCISMISHLAPASALEVIGSGYGRTGTFSLKTALDELGYKTYHMKEIVHASLLSDVHVWKMEAETNCSDVDAMKELFDRGGWTAAVDFPSSMCWETLIKAYPAAKVIHTERESADKWWDSASSTIAFMGTKFPLNVVQRVVPFFIAHSAMVDSLWSFVTKKNVSVRDDGFPFIYKQQFIDGYESNNARVREIVPSDRLLVQNHKNGWTDLCTFLDKDVPELPYPHSNSRDEFVANIRKLSISISLAFLASLASFALAAYLAIRAVKYFVQKPKME